MKTVTKFDTETHERQKTKHFYFLFFRLLLWSPVTASEMKVFLALVITTGLVIKPTLEEYWSTDDIISTPFFPKHMALVRFQSILSNFHVVDNRLDDGSDPLFKVRPFVTHLRRRFVEVYSPSRDLSFDEATCPWKGRLRFRVYNPAKPDKFGIKLYATTEAKSGYLLGFDIYQGATRATNYTEALEIQEDLTLTTQTVLGLLTFCGLLGKGHHVYMDNYYNSPELFHQLALFNTYACGTVRVNRHGMPAALKKQRAREDRILLRQGQTIFRQKDNMLAVKHHDKRDVFMITTIHPPLEVQLDKVDEDDQHVWKPLCIVEYIQKMGGVDTADQIMKNYSVLRKTVKWWRKLFFYLFTSAICNAYCLHQKCTAQPLSHYIFRKKIVRQLILTTPDAPQPVPRGRKAANPPQRLLGKHKPVYNIAKAGAKRQRPARDCVACNPPSRNRTGFKRKMSTYQCEQCEITLCVPHCFNVYHSVVDYKRVLQQPDGDVEPDNAGDN